MHDIDQKGHVFLVEDDDAIREDLAELLRYVGYRVTTYIRAEDFLAATVHVAPAVIISDVRMPGMSGIMLQSKLLDGDRQLPIIFISGESSKTEVVTGMKQGAVDFLLKPFGREELFDAVSRALSIDAQNVKKIARQTRLQLLLKDLSPRERQVFELLCKAYSNNELVSALGVSLETAKQYKQEVMRKLEIKKLSDLIALVS